MDNSDEHTTAVNPGLRRQVLAFGAVGLLNTAVDFSILNACIFLFGLSPLPSNIISVSIALCLSFMLNNRWVFAGNATSRRRGLLLFIPITLVGLYGFQSVIIYLFTTEILWPASMVERFSQIAGLELSYQFIVANTAKLLATVISMVWNFLMYKKFVFRQ